MKTILEKYKVCTRCFGVGMVDHDCLCSYSGKYDLIELEFEVCACCGKLIEDGRPADTPFNTEQLQKLNLI